MNREPQRRNEDYRYQERSNIDQNRNYNREREYRISERERLEREKEKERIERIRQQDRNYNLNQKERQERVQQLEQMNVANEEKKIESNDVMDVAKKKKDKGKVLITILNILLGLVAIGIAAAGYIYGTGNVNFKSGSTVYESMQILDFRGGDATTDMSQQTNKM